MRGESVATVSTFGSAVCVAGDGSCAAHRTALSMTLNLYSRRRSSVRIANHEGGQFVLFFLSGEKYAFAQPSITV